MTVQEIQEVLDKMEKQGLTDGVLTMPAPKFRGAYPLRVRTPFGLCRWYPSNDAERVIIFPTRSQLEKFVKRVLKHLETARPE